MWRRVSSCSAMLKRCIDVSWCRVGGVLAAKACSDHFERVILVEPEFSKTLSGKPKTRVMQYNSAHGMYMSYVPCSVISPLKITLLSQRFW